MPTGRLLPTLLGFLAAVLVLGGLVVLVGIDAFASEVGSADTRSVAIVVAATIAWLAAWGLGLRTVLGVLGIDVSAGQSFLLVNGAMFANNITPFGQAGGEPITALLISKRTATEYERGLAAIVSLDTLNLVPSVSLALIGAGYYATQVTFNRQLRIATGGLVVLAAGFAGAGYLVWRHRNRIESVAIGLLVSTIGRFTSAVPALPTITRGGLAVRFHRFRDAIARVGTSRRALALSLAAAAAGWGFQMVALWVAFQAIGSTVPFSVTLFVVPLSALASVAPLPGGMGGIEAVLVGLLASVPGVGISLETALAAVVIFRGSVYWTPVVIGGVVMSVNGIDAL